MSRLLVEVDETEAQYHNPDAEDPRSGVRYLPIHRRNGQLDFPMALVALKAGHRVRRAGWNGKGMWLALTPGSSIPTMQRDDTSRLRGAALVYYTAEMPDEIRIGAHIDMRAADGTLVIGWQASQTDMLAEDWEVLP